MKDEWWNYSTSKPSKLVTDKGCRGHDIMTCRSIQRFCGAHHTPGLGHLVVNLVFIQKDLRNALVDFKCLGQGLEAVTDQGWHFVRGSTVKTWSLKSRKQLTFNWDMSNPSDSKLGKTMKNNPEIHGFIQHLHTVWHTAGLGVFDNSTQSEINNETTAPPNHPNLSLSQDAGKVWESDIMTCRSIQRFCGAHHTPGLGALVTNLVPSQIDVRDGLVEFKCLGQGLETETDQGWHLVRGSTVKTWCLKCSEKKDIQLRHVQSLWIETWKNNAEIHRFIQHLHINLLTTQLDQRWTIKLQHLQTSNLSLSTGCPGHDIFHQIAAAFSGAHHTPGLGALGTNLVPSQIDVRDGLVDFKCLGQGLEAATDQGWRLVRRPFGQHLISEMLKKRTFNWDMSNLSDSKLEKTIPIQHLHICWQLNSIKDER